MLDLFRAALGNRVSEVRESKRLTDSPCCLVNADGGMSTQMQRLLKMANKEFTESAAHPRNQSVGAPGAPALPAECQQPARRVHQDLRAATLVATR